MSSRPRSLTNFNDFGLGPGDFGNAMFGLRPRAPAAPAAAESPKRARVEAKPAAQTPQKKLRVMHEAVKQVIAEDLSAEARAGLEECFDYAAECGGKPRDLYIAVHEWAEKYSKGDDAVWSAFLDGLRLTAAIDDALCGDKGSSDGDDE